MNYQDYQTAKTEGKSFNRFVDGYISLTRADLRGADLRDADLRDADLRGADLRDADLRDADLRGADLSGAVNLLTTTDYLEANFEFLADGSMVVYKSFGTNYAPPAHWVIEAGSILTENVNPDRGTSCGSGVNVATRNWGDFEEHKRDLWKCIIKPQWLGSVVVPFGTDGKIRCEKIQLVEIINKREE